MENYLSKCMMLRIFSPMVSNSRRRTENVAPSVRPYDKKGDADVERKGKHEDVELGKDSGEDAKNQVGDQEQGQDRGAEFDPENKHVTG